MYATVDEILIWYDGPRLVQGHTNENNPILALSVDDDNWDCLVSCISQETMDGVLENRICLREAFTTLRIGPAYKSTIGGVWAILPLVKMESEPTDDWLPEADCFLSA